MPEATPRMQRLKALLVKSPEDAFILYGLAMEHKNTGDAPAAIEYFDRVIAVDDGYCYAYHQRGLVYESLGNKEAARKSYREGMAAADRKGDAHAKSEIEAQLETLS